MPAANKEDERRFILECIELYKSLPAVWKVKSDEYSNRTKKEAAYSVLTKKYQQLPKKMGEKSSIPCGLITVGNSRKYKIQ